MTQQLGLTPGWPQKPLALLSPLLEEANFGISSGREAYAVRASNTQQVPRGAGPMSTHPCLFCHSGARVLALCPVVPCSFYSSKAQQKLPWFCVNEQVRAQPVCFTNVHEENWRPALLSRSGKQQVYTPRFSLRSSWASNITMTVRSS